MWVSFQVDHNASLVGLINCRGAVSVGFDVPIELQCILADLSLSFYKILRILQVRQLYLGTRDHAC